MVEWLAGKDPSLLDCVNQNGRTPLQEACEDGDLSVVKKLVDLEPTLMQRKDYKKESLLLSAVLSGNLELVEWLAGKDPSLLVSFCLGCRTPLHSACGLGDICLYLRNL